MSTLPRSAAARIRTACLALLTVLASDAAHATSIIVDNDASGFTYTPTASWSTSTATSGYYGSNYRVDNTDGADTGLAAKWTPTITTSGYYRISMRWAAGANRPDAAPLEIAWQGGSKVDSSRLVDQTKDGGAWVFIGTYYLAAGTGNYVKIKATDAGRTIADAVRFDLSAASSSAPSYSALTAITPSATARRVRIRQTDTGAFVFSIDGQPFFARGVCNLNRVEDMALAGANAARCYSPSALDDGVVLDDADLLDTRVIVGLWMRHEDTSFTYAGNPAYVASQLATLKSQVDAYKDHPAVLAWSIGNEVDVSTSANPEAIYAAIEEVARYIKQVDPNHPTVSVHAGSSQTKITRIREWAPDIDIVAFNSYHHIGNVRTNVLGAGWIGPYLVTEFSIDQPSESAETSWGAALEPYSADKYTTYLNSYNDYILANDDLCLGSFAFTTSDAFRVTHTWYNLLLDAGSGLAPTPAFDAMQKAWTGTDPSDLTPRISYLSLNAKTADQNVTLATSGAYRALVNVTQSQGQTLTYRYEIRPEAALTATTAPTPVSISFTPDSSDARAAWFNTSALSTGNYRLFAYVTDPAGRVGTASLPFRVQ